MIDPIDELPPDDSGDLENEDQPSQQDIHSNGLDISPEDLKENTEPETDLLKLASDASEAAYTLKLDDIPKGSEKKK
jgi:hypothetical protein